MWGARSSLAEHGILADVQMTQFYQGVSSGGVEQKDAYGGKLDYMFTIDGGKLGLHEGFMTILHAETRFGEAIGAEAGAFAIPNTNMLWPLPGTHETSITGLLFIQALSERVSLAGGKINVADFWTMFYPNVGRGVEGFMNLNLLAAGMPWLRYINLSINGAGALVMQGEQIQGAFFVFDTNNSSTTTGLNDLFDQGAGIIGIWRFFTDWNGKPGSHLFAGGWSSRTYTSLNDISFTFIPGEGLELDLGKETGPWSLAYYFDQVIWADRCNEKRKVQLFTGASLSDGNPSFSRWNWFASLEAFGLIDGREQDRMGAAYFYNGLSSDLKRSVRPVLNLQDLQGVEFYYSAAVTPWFHVTADLQVVDNGNVRDDTAIIPGLRARVEF
jgi:porin